MTLSEELQWRGFFNQTTFKDISVLDEKPLTFYWGVDPSADSMTIGNLAAAMMARHFIDHGHKAVLLVGGATGLIGDPDGKKDERSLKSVEEIERNKQAIAAQYRRIFEGEDFTLVDNYDWFKDIGYLQFLRDIGKHLSMTQLLDREFVKARIGEGGSGISYAEFSYSLIQGYDFLHLFRNYSVTLQLCGADQWGNSLAGVEMIRKLEGKEAHVYSTPLIVNKATGKKFGKSEDGAVWLDAGKTSVFKFYQFWLNADDAGVIDYMKVYTLLPKEEIEAIERDFRAAPHQRLAQRRLAEEVTALVHGRERLQAVQKVTEVLYGKQSFEDLSESEVELLAHEVPTLAKGEHLSHLMVRANLAASNGDARRLLAAGGVTFNGQKIHDDTVVERPGLIKKGKNSFALVR